MASLNISLEDDRATLADFYRKTLVDDVIPFWLRHGIDQQHGGIITSLNRDGSVLDTDKSMWFQGRAAWTFATLYNTLENRTEWLTAAQSCVEFSRRHGYSQEGKMYFSVTKEGAPLRMRRYVFSESFASIANAAYAKAAGDDQAAADAIKNFGTYLRYSFEPGMMLPKFEPTRPMRGIGPLMIGIATAQELRENLGNVEIGDRNCTEWIDHFVTEIERYFFKPDLRVLMESVGLQGEIIDHHDGRTLNPGHAIECAWFVMHEGALRQDPQLIQMGTTILDWMWDRGWDQEYGGLLYFRDLRNLPVQEYWHDMKFWWPHNEAIIATLLAYELTGNAKYANWHQQVHDWSFQHFADPEFGEWYGYLHRDGRISSPAKGTMYKGPFHLPRMLWYAHRRLSSASFGNSAGNTS